VEALVAVIGKADNVAILVLLVVCAGLAWAHVVWRREEREERARYYEALQSNTRALEAFRIALSYSVGKPL